MKREYVLLPSIIALVFFVLGFGIFMIHLYPSAQLYRMDADTEALERQRIIDNTHAEVEALQQQVQGHDQEAELAKKLEDLSTLRTRNLERMRVNDELADRVHRESLLFSFMGPFFISILIWIVAFLINRSAKQKASTKE